MAAAALEAASRPRVVKPLRTLPPSSATQNKRRSPSLSLPLPLFPRLVPHANNDAVAPADDLSRLGRRPVAQHHPRRVSLLRHLDSPRPLRPAPCAWYRSTAPASLLIEIEQLRGAACDTGGGAWSGEENKIQSRKAPLSRPKPLFAPPQRPRAMAIRPNGRVCSRADCLDGRFLRCFCDGARAASSLSLSLTPTRASSSLLPPKLTQNHSVVPRKAARIAARATKQQTTSLTGLVFQPFNEVRERAAARDGRDGATAAPECRSSPAQPPPLFPSLQNENHRRSRPSSRPCPTPTPRPSPSRAATTSPTSRPPSTSRSSA